MLAGTNAKRPFTAGGQRGVLNKRLLLEKRLLLKKRG